MFQEFTVKELLNTLLFSAALLALIVCLGGMMVAILGGFFV